MSAHSNNDYGNLTTCNDQPEESHFLNRLTNRRTINWQLKNGEMLLGFWHFYFLSEFSFAQFSNGILLEIVLRKNFAWTACSPLSTIANLGLRYWKRVCVQSVKAILIQKKNIYCERNLTIFTGNFHIGLRPMPYSKKGLVTDKSYKVSSYICDKIYRHEFCWTGLSYFRSWNTKHFQRTTKRVCFTLLKQRRQTPYKR